jgi:Methyl-accepting chemotaxis protein
VLERDQNSQSEVILNNTSLTLGQFEKKYYDCSERVENIANNSKNVSKNIGNIVTSIQFHDITRQQMEHVYEALEEVSGKINLSGFRGSVKEVPEDNLSTLHDVCELQSYQFSSSINEFVEAVDNIILHLKDVEHNVTDIFSDTLCLLAEDDSSGDNSRKDNSLSAVKTELSAILSSLHKNEEISEELSKSIKSVVEIVEDLAKYVLEIEEIGTEIEIIALNARIKAAHTGLNGLALGVLAEEIQKLSIDAKAQTISVTGILQDIGKISKTLKMSIDESAQKEDSNSVSDINEKIIGLINTIIDLEKDTKVTIDGIRTKVTNLKDDINKTADNIKIHHQNKQIADGINALLMAIISVLKKNINPAVNKKSNVDNLLAKYTMDSERQIHERFSKKEKLAIENNDDESEKKQDDFFGDNVDLF